MAAQDASRFWRGCVAIAQESARLRAFDFNQRAKLLQHHAADVVRFMRQEAGQVSAPQFAWPPQQAAQQERSSTATQADAEADYNGEPHGTAWPESVLRQQAAPLPQESGAGEYVTASATTASAAVFDQGLNGTSISTAHAAYDNYPAEQPATSRAEADMSKEYIDQVALAAGLRTAEPPTTQHAVHVNVAEEPAPQSAVASAGQTPEVGTPAAPVSPAVATAAEIPAQPAAASAQPAADSPPPSQAGSASTPAQEPHKPIRRKRQFREVAVPASPLARVFGFGSLAASMAFGAAGEAVTRGLGMSQSSGQGGAIHMSEAQAERLAEGLCRMRGAALKIGQMLSLSDESMIPPAVAKVLERVRTQADVMPKKQLEKQMATELGADWKEKLGGSNFSEAPVAAASIGQVHRSTLPDGRDVAVKVQYPGVAESINSDLNNLKRLLTVMNFLPKGLYLDSVIQVAREELTAECDYVREAECQEHFRALVAGDSDFEVPSVVPHLSTRRVLTTTWLRGVPIDAAVDAGLGMEGRTRIARKLLKLTLKELFEWRFMQTDPNWGNFFYDTDRDVIGLLDFGATRSFRKEFVDEYLKLVWAAANNDRDTILDSSIKLGFLTGHESKVMLNAHIDSGLVVGEPFRSHEPFDFKASGMTQRVGQHGATFAEHRLTPPPTEVYSLHRKLAGAFLICIRMGAVMPCRDMLEQVYDNYKWGPLDGAGQAGVAQPVPAQGPVLLAGPADVGAAKRAAM